MSATAVDTKTKIRELRAKAFVPPKLPEDFLRVSLNQQQITENQDSILAHRLQYGVHPQHQQQQQPQRMWRVPPRGRLNITVIEARLAKNYSMLTKMDPYVKIHLGGKVFETETDYGSGKNPKWNKTICCYLPHNVDSFALQIFDEKSFSTDEEVAVLNYSFPDELFQGVIVDEWLPLSGRLGEQKEGNIHLRLEFIPIEQLARVQQPQIQPQRIPVPVAVQYPPQAAATTVRLPPPQQPIAQQQEEEEENELEYTEEDVKAIKEMFPSFDDEIIKSILEANDGHKENTINQLLQMS